MVPDMETLAAPPSMEWIPSQGNHSAYTLLKKEYGHLSKKKGVYRKLRYHHQPSLALLVGRTVCGSRLLLAVTSNHIHD
jgi:hypothetical protein